MTSMIPDVFKNLAQSAGYDVEVGIAADKGGNFESYASSAAIQSSLHSSKWDIVILQEQTQIPSIPHLRSSKMYPSAKKLIQKIKSIGAIPIFFQTSGNQNGWPENGILGYKNMQLAIIEGYSEISNELGVGVAPVGYSWYIAMDNSLNLELWKDDRHPNENGAYLAACTIYATVFRESSEGLNYSSNLPKNIANTLQSIGSTSVLDNLAKWNLSE